MLNLLKRRFKSQEDGLSALEITVGMVIFIAVSIGVTALIVTQNEQVSDSSDVAYINNEINVASQLIGRAIAQSTDIISVETDEVILENNNGTSTVIAAVPVEPTNPDSQCKVNITKYAANGVTVIEDVEVVTTLESCTIFTEVNNKVSFNLQVMSADSTIYSMSSVASTGYYSGTNDIGGFEVAAVIPAPNSLGIENSGIDAVGRNNILLSWDAVTGASNYVLQASADGVSWYIVNAYVLNNFFDVENLVPETLYYFRVAAQNAEGVGAYSETYSATTLPGSVTTAPAVTVTPSPTSLAVNWSEPSDNGGYAITGYKVRYKLGSSNEWIETTTNASTLTYSIFGLSKYTIYNIEVQALNFKGYSASGSPVGTVRTLATAPTSVTDLVVLPKDNGTSIDVEWGLPTDDGMSGAGGLTYDIQYKEVTSETWIDDDSISNLSTTLTGLKKYTNYDIRVRATNMEGSSEWDSVSVRTLATVPNAPTGLTATNVLTTSFTINWNAPADTGMEGIGIYEYRITLSQGANIIGEYTIDGDITTYNFTGLTRGTTYTFSVKASNSVKGFGSAVSDTQKTAILPPNAPALSFVSKTNTQVTVSWVYPTDDGGDAVLGYNVYRGNTKVNGSLLPANTTSYTFTGLTQLTEYTFYVTAVNSHPDEGAKQDPGVTVTTHPDPPCTPTGLTLTGYSGTSLQLDWTAPCGVIDGYKIYLNGNYVAQIQGTTYTFSDLSPSTQYTLGVAATNVTGDSSTATLVRATSPGEVGNLQLSTIGTTTASINWTASAGAVTGYKIYVAVDDGGALTYDYLATTTNTQYNFTGLQYNTKYRFGVVAVNSYNVESQREAVIGTTKPAAVTSLTTGERTTSTIEINWTAPTSGNSTLTGYKVYLDGVLYATIANAATTTYVIGSTTPLTSNTYYDISVRATNATGEGADSTITAKTRVTIPLSPEVTVTLQDYDKITISWTKPSGVIDGYKIYFSEGSSGEPQLFDIVLDENQLSYTFGSGELYGALVGNPALKDSTQYRIGVAAANGIVNDGGDSAVTTLTSSTTVRPPVEVTESNNTLTSITLNWGCKASTAPNVFKIYVNSVFLTNVSPTNGCAAVNAATATAYSYNITDLTPNTNYTLSVVSSVTEGVSSLPAEVSTATLSAPPTSITQDATNTTDTTARITWTAPSGNANSGYKVYVDGVAVSALESDTLATNYTITGLSSSTRYSVTVKALTAGGYSTDSTPVNVDTRPSAPVLSQNGNATTTSYAVSWTKPGGTVNSYTLEYKLSTSGTWTTVNIANGNTTTYLIEGLTGGRTYNTRIKAVGLSSLESSYSNTLNVTTLLSAPTTVTIGTVTTSTIAVSWSTVTNASSYDVYVDGVFYAKITAPTLTTTITGLDYGKTYTIGVKTVNSQGLPSTNTTTANGTTVTASPTGLTVTSVKNDSVSISWNAPSGSGTPSGYKIYDGSTLVTTVGAGTTTYTLTGRTGGTSYSGSTAIGVATTVTTGGTDSATVTSSYLTTPDAPTLSSYTSTTSSITVNWTAPSGTVTGYKVYKNGVLLDTIVQYNTPSIVNSSAQSADSTTMPVPSGAQLGDVLLYVWSSDTQTMSVPTGFIGAGYSGSTTFGGFAYKTITGSVDTQISGLQNLRTTENVHMLFILRNVDAATLIEAASSATGTSGMPNPPSLANVVSGSLVLALGHLDDDAVASSVTAPSGYTLTRAAQAPTASESTVTGMVAHKISTGGIEDPDAFGGTGTDGWVADTIAFQPTVSSSLSYTINDLNPNTSYTDIEIVAYNASGNGEALSPTMSTTPEAPTGLTVSNITATGGRLSWTAPSGNATTGYEVFLNGSNVGSTNSSTLFYDFSALTAGTSYTVGVRTVNPAGNSSTSTTTLLTLLSSPTSLSFSSATTNSITIGFTSPAGVKTGYNVYVDGVKHNTTLVSDTQSTATARTYVVTGLDYGKNYTIAVGYENASGEGTTASTSSNMTTLTAAPASASQTGGDTNGTTYNAIITWTAPSGSGTTSSYKIYRGATLIGQVNAPTLTFNAGGGAGVSGANANNTALNVGTSYTISVAAVSSSGVETTSGNRISVTTTANTVTGLTVTNVLNDRATLSWSSQSNISGYRIYSNSGSTVIATVSSGTTSYTVTGLSSGAAYAAGVYRIKAFTVNGESASFANFSAFETLLDPPTLSSTTSTTTSVTVNWTAPNGSAITGYRVYDGSTLLKDSTYSTSTTNTPSVVNSSSYTGASNNMPVPSGAQLGDVLLYVFTSDNQTMSLPTGFAGAGYSNAVRGGFAYKTITGSVDTTVSGLTTSDGTTTHMLFILRGVDAATLIEAASSATGISGMPNSPSLANVVSGSLVLALGHLDDDVVSASVTAPSGYTLTRAAQNGVAEAGSTGMVAHKISTGGTEDPAVFGGTGTDAWIADTIAFQPSVTVTPEPLTHTFSGLNPNTTYTNYKIVAYNASGESAPLNLTLTTSPSTLSNLTVTDAASTTLTVTWTAASGNATTGYKVYLNGSAIQSSGSDLILSSGATSYTFTGLTSATTYTLGVSAINASGNTALTTVSGTTRIGAPTGLALSSATTNSITIGFTSPAGVKTGYNVYVDGVKHNTTLVSDTQSTATARTYEITGLDYGKNYTIAVGYENASGEGTTASASMATITAIPASISQTSGTTNGTTFNAVITWTAPSGSGTTSSYKIYRGATLIGQVNAPTLTFNAGGGAGVSGANANNTALNVGTSYTISVAAVSADGVESASRSFTTNPSQVTGTAVATANITQTTARLSWTTDSSVSGYQIYNGVELLATLNSNVSSYDISSLTSGTTYAAGTWTVRAFNAYGQSTAANFPEFTTLLTAPTGLAINQSGTTTTQIEFSFTSPAGVKTGYKVYLDGVLNKTVADTLPGATFKSETITGLTTGKTYAISVLYYNTTGDGAATTPVNMSTLMSAPASAAQTGGNTNGTTYSAVIEWTAPASGTVANYKVYVDGVQNGSTLSSSTLTQTLTGLTVGTTYAVSIAAVSTDGVETSSGSRRTVSTVAVAPTTNAASGITTTAATLNWTENTAASGYRLYNGETLVDTLPRTTTSYNLTGLTSGTAYNAGAWTLKTFNVNGESSATNFPAFTTYIGTATGLTIDAGTTTSDTIGFTFTSPEGVKTSYSVYVDGVFNKTVADTTTASTSRSNTVSGLAFGKTYAISIIYTNATGDGAATASVNMSTLMAAPASAAQNGGGTNGTTYSAVIEWTAPSGTGTVSSYRVYVDGVKNGSDIASPTTTATLTGLTVGTTYAVAIAAVSAEGIETLSGNRIPVTTVAASVSPTAATNVASTTATLNWGFRAATSGYRIYNGATPVATIDRGTQSYNLTGLTANTTYPAGTWTLKTFNVNGESTPLDFPAFTTTPSGVSSFAVSSSTSTSISLSWAAITGVTIENYKVEISSNDGSTWSDAANATGTSTTVSGLTANTKYLFRISAKNTENASYGPVSSNLTGYTKPDAPATPSVSNQTTTSFKITWTAPSGSETTGYKVYLDGGYINQVSSSTLEYTFTGLNSGTAYYAQVAAVNPSGDSSISTQVNTFTVPESPTNLTVTDLSGTTATISWTKPSGTSSYKVYVDGVAVQDGGSDLILSSAATSYQFTGLTAGVTYTLGVRAYNTSGQSSIVTTNATTTATPQPVTNLTLSSVTNTSITASWTGTASATGYKVYVNGVYNSTPTGTTITLNDLSASTSYTIGVASTNAFGDSTVVEATTATLPNAPTLNTVSSTTDSITVSWNAPSGSVSGYKVYLDGVLQETYVSGVDANTHTFTGLNANTLYNNITITAYNAANAESLPLTVSSTTKPAAPSGLSVTNVSTTSATLNWSAPSGSATTGYKIYLNSTLVTTINDPATLTYNLTGLSSNTAYASGAVTIVAMNAGGDSSSGNFGAFTTLATAPTGLTSTAETTTSVNLSWTAPSGSASLTYRVDYSTDNTNWTQFGTATSSITRNVTGLNSNTLYYFRVLAVNDGGNSSYTSSYSRTTLAAASTVTVSNPTTTTLDISWTAATGPASVTYTVSIGGTPVASGLTNTTYQATGLTSGTSYTIDVATVNASGSSSGSTTGVTVPEAPTSVTTTDITGTTVTISWVKPSGTPSYKVYVDGVAVQDGGSDLILSSAATSYQFTGLTPGVAYTLGVRAYNNSGQSSIVTTNATTASVPQPVTNLTLSSVTNTSITASWTASSSATGYKVYVNGVYDSTPTGTTITLNSLISATTYTIGVIATNTYGDAAVVEATTVTLPAAPTSLTNDAFTTSTITMSWTASSGAISGYKVYVGGTAVQDGGSDLVLSAGTTSYEFTGLTAGTSYTLGVRALTTGGESSLATLASATKTNAPSSVSVSALSANSVSASWVAPSGSNITGYKVYVNGVYYADDDASPLTITGLAAGTNHKIGVTAIRTISGESATGEGYGLTNIDTPTNLSVTNPTVSTLTLNWTPPATGNPSQGYRIEVTTTQHVTVYGVTSYTMTGLSPNTSYSFRIRAVNENQQSGATSFPVTSTTGYNPAGFNFTNRTADTINVSWNNRQGTASSNIWLFQDGALSATLANTATTHSFTGLDASTSYELGISTKSSSPSDIEASITVSTLASSINPTVVATATTDLGAATSGTVNLPAGMQAGDLVFVTVGTDTTLASSGGGIHVRFPSIPNDWVSLERRERGQGGTNTTANPTDGGVFSHTFYKVMGATPDTTVQVTNISEASSAVAVAVRNAGSMPNMRIATAVSSNVASAVVGMPNPPSMSMGVTGSLMIIVGVLDDDIPSVGAPAGFENLASQSSNQGTTARVTTMLATKVSSVAATEDPAVFAGSGEDTWVAKTISIAPVEPNVQGLPFVKSTAVFRSDAGGNQTMGLPSSTTNDITIVTVSSSTSTPPLPTSNFWADLGTSSNGSQYQRTFAYFHQGNTPTLSNYAFPANSTAIIFVVTNVKGFSYATANGGSGMPNAPSISTPYHNSLAVAIGAVNANVSNVSQPTGYNNVISIRGTNAQTIMMADEIISTPGTEDATAFGGSGNASWVANKFVFHPIMTTPSTISSAPTLTYSATNATAEIVGSTSADFGTSTSSTLNLPSGLQEGDMVIVNVGSTASTPALPSGWTDLDSTTSAGQYQRLFYKFMGAVPDTSVAITNISTSSVGAAVAVRHAANAAPTVTTTSGTTNIALAAVTTTVNNSLVLAMATLDDDHYTMGNISTSQNFSTAPTNAWKKLLSHTSATATTSGLPTGAGGGTGGNTVMVAARIVPTAGSSNSVTLVPSSSASDDWVAHRIIIAPVVNTDIASYTWSPVTGATAYSIYLDNAFLTTTTNSHYNFKLSEMPLGAAAQLTVRSLRYDQFGLSATSSQVFRKLPEPYRTDTPTLTNATPTSVTLNWVAPIANSYHTTGSVTNYKIYLDGVYVATVDAATLSYNFTDLDIGKGYTLGVRASNAGGDSRMMTVQLARAR